MTEHVSTPTAIDDGGHEGTAEISPIVAQASAFHKTYAFYSFAEVEAMTLGQIDGRYGTEETVRDGLIRMALADAADWLTNHDPDEIAERKTRLEWEDGGVYVHVSLEVRA